MKVSKTTDKRLKECKLGFKSLMIRGGVSTFKETCKHLGVSKSYISQCLSGDPRYNMGPEMQRKVALLFNCERSEIEKLVNARKNYLCELNRTISYVGLYCMTPETIEEINMVNAVLTQMRK